MPTSWRDVVSGLNEEHAPLIELLVTRGLLRSTPSGEFDFCHGVVRAGAEGQLVRERLTSLHRRIADALAKRPMAETAEGASRIGNHYDRAGEALAAIPQLLRAGRAYAGLRALLEAVAHLRRAFELLRAIPSPPPELEGPVGLGLASGLAALDRTGEAAAVLESLDLERVGAEDRLRLATVHVQAGWLRFSNENDVARGRALVERGLRAVQELPDGGDTRLLAWSFLTRIELLDGRLERGAGRRPQRRRARDVAPRRPHRPRVRALQRVLHPLRGRATPGGPRSGGGRAPAGRLRRQRSDWSRRTERARAVAALRGRRRRLLGGCGARGRAGDGAAARSGFDTTRWS